MIVADMADHLPIEDPNKGKQSKGRVMTRGKFLMTAGNVLNKISLQYTRVCFHSRKIHTLIMQNFFPTKYFYAR